MNNTIAALLNLVVMDAIFLCVLSAIFGLVAGTKRAAFAVMKRNFVGYFQQSDWICVSVHLRLSDVGGRVLAV